MHNYTLLTNYCQFKQSVSEAILVGLGAEDLHESRTVNEWNIRARRALVSGEMSDDPAGCVLREASGQPVFWKICSAYCAAPMALSSSARVRSSDSERRSDWTVVLNSWATPLFRTRNK